MREIVLFIYLFAPGCMYPRCAETDAVLLDSLTTDKPYDAHRARYSLKAQPLSVSFDCRSAVQPSKAWLVPRGAPNVITRAFVIPLCGCSVDND
ncbi:hypothetical protein EVAR_12514_1 [Eumeta japonica]|uniref:Uncharacterized protein n=1 Tax=Eumeta variegata TaxID=151549 RepID=A0A4C1TPN7_EUMVA|nr:hypothetical protein EVAR_12514_1 [Eumeta japonica]